VLAENVRAACDAFTIVEGAGGDAFEIDFHRIDVVADGFDVGRRPIGDRAIACGNGDPAVHGIALVGWLNRKLIRVGIQTE
jgi:hypothetical protein